MFKFVVVFSLFVFSSITFANVNLSELQFEKKLDESTDSRAWIGNKVELLNDGQEALERRIQLIESAKHHIHFTSLTWDNDEVGHMFKDLFIKKVREGVKVRVILDETVITGNIFYGKFNKGRDKIVKEMRDAGVDVILYNPPGTFAPLWSNTHEKFIIVDGKRAIAGGRNQGKKYFTYARDADVYIEGYVLHRLQNIFMTKWKINARYDYRKWLRSLVRKVNRIAFLHPVKYRNRTTRHTRFMGASDLRQMLKSEKTLNRELKKLRDDRNYGSWWDVKEFKKDFRALLKKENWEKYKQRKRDYTSIPKDRPEEYYPHFMYQNENVKVRVAHHLPQERGDDNIKNLYINLIDRAQKRIVIQNAYFFPKRHVLNSLVRAVKRGVEVIVMTNSPETTDEGKIKKFMRYPYLKLLELNRRRAAKKMKVYELKNEENGDRRLLHGKTMVVDGKYTLIGSYNLDRKSEDWSSEHAVLIYGEQQAQEQLEYYENALENEYEPYTLDKLDKIRRKLFKQMESEDIMDYFVKKFV